MNLIVCHYLGRRSCNEFVLQIFEENYVPCERKVERELILNGNINSTEAYLSTL